MQNNSDNINRNDHIVCKQFFSWTPILIGALVALGLGFLLDLFGMGIGLSSYTTDVNGATALAIGGLIGLIIGTIATMFTAGFAAGFFAGPTCNKRNFGVVYGFVAWCLSLLLVGIFASGVHSYMNIKSSHGAAYSSAGANEMAMTSENVASRVHPATDSRDTRGEKQVRAAGLMSLSMFILFFIGALSASFGGYYGFYYWDKWEEYRSNRR